MNYDVYDDNMAQLYFTVVPLYQKAALEEGVARLEHELKVLGAAHEESYSRLRDLAVREYVSYAGAECSGVLIPLPAPGTRSRRAEDYQDALGIEATFCLTKNLKETKALSNLRKQDFDRLSDRVAQLANELDAERLKVLREFQGVPEKLSEPESRQIALAGFSGEWDRVIDDIQSRGLSVAGRAEQRHRSVIAQLQREIVAAYAKKVRDGIFQLRRMDWPQ